MVRGKQGAWDPQICLSWGERFLTWIRSNVESGNIAPGSVWRATFTPRAGVEFSLLREEERREVEAGEDRVGFLPTWYWKEVQENISGAHSSSTSDGEAKPSRSSAAPTASAAGGLPTGWRF
jgi:RAT1-interacting protein